MLPFGALASPRRGLCGSVGAGMVASFALSGDRRLGKTVRRQHHLPDVFAVLNEMMAAAASSKGKVRMICRMASPENELVVAAIECPRSKCVNRTYISGRYGLPAAMTACQKSTARNTTTTMRRIRPRVSAPKLLSWVVSRPGSLMRNYSVARQHAYLTRD
jgi:hypothetical protein